MSVTDYLKNKFKIRQFLSLVLNYLSKNKKKISGKNNNINFKEAVLRKVVIDIAGNDNELIIKKGSKISNAKIFIRGTGHRLIIGENFSMASGTLWIEDENCKIIIGDKTTIGDASIAVTEPNSTISIGEDCMLSSDIEIINGDSHSIIDKETNKRINFAEDIVIGNHVWIGAHVQILKGVKIGNDSIIGTRSLVTKDVANSCVAAGVPAKEVKKNVTWRRDRIYDRAASN